MRLITHVRDRVSRDLTLDHHGSISAVSRMPCAGGPGLGMFRGQGLLVPAQRVGQQPVGPARSPEAASSMARLAAAINVSGWSSPSAARHLVSVSWPIRIASASIAAGGQVGGVVDARRQGERMQIAVASMNRSLACRSRPAASRTRPDARSTEARLTIAA